MTDHTTEDQLRSALLSLAPRELDVTDFRARLDALIADGAQPSHPAPTPEHGGQDDVVVPLLPARRSDRSRRSRTALGVTLAAVAASVAALVVALVPGSGDHPARPGSGTGVPAEFRAMALPGTIVLGTYSGTGSRRIPIPVHTVPRYFQYAAYVQCSGGGSITVFDAGVEPACSPSTTFGTSGHPVDGTVPVDASTRTSWRIALVIEPQTRSNGSLQGPVDDDMSGPDNDLRQTGQGSESVHFVGDALAPAGRRTTYRLRLVCHGSGVRLPDLSGDRATGGLDTRTCFAGRMYVWNSVPLTLPGTVRVVAAAGTGWTIAIDPMG